MMSEAEQLSYVMNELAEIKKILADFVSGTASNDTSNVNLPPSGKEYLTVDEAAALIGSKRSYIYKLTHEKRISFTKPGGNRVLIKRSDLLDWIEANRIKSQKDVQNDVEQFMKNSRRPGRKAPKR
ncbi:helix-turn-helix domain-containing protein [Escherichia coli]|jgi:excisionase family DNA binding protein|uniref:helix-turn-helix domain-containing protein n=1 Tax=Escherichia coli TaxID=562 RepID=UPI002874AC6D|nr:helix-turn-helix domain-containing protein [Escherichia coli]MDS0773393.1 helix-turn-helix domain-containing protein [Escherichia coli]MDT3795477.1 helix-turn-helix domain-containing protein [Escherichia coli]